MLPISLPARPGPLRSSVVGPALGSILLLIAASCGGSGEAEADPGDPGVVGGAAVQQPSVPAAEEVAPIFESLPSIFTRRNPRPAKSVRIHMRRREADKAGWTTEVVSNEVEPMLEHLLDQLLAGDPVDASLFDSDWGGVTRLVPQAIEVEFDDGALSVARGVELDGELHGRNELPALAAELAARYAEHAEGLGLSADVAPIVSRVEIVGIRGEAGVFETRARVQIARRGAAPMQHNLQLGVTWVTEENHPPRLRALTLQSFEEVRAAAPLFAEVTDYALDGTPHYASDILCGVDAYMGRTDRAAGFALQGMQGVAVGDINGDGRDDVYVCQQIGLPNQLLFAGPDGKFIDGARESNVDFLELTRAALILDWDNDGDQDLVLGIGAMVFLCLNDGAGVFSRPTSFTARGGAHFYNLSAADADGDGDLDLYGGRYSLGGVMRGAPAPYHDASNGAPNYYLRNDGPEEMVEATQEAGFDVLNTKFTLASIWEDLDDDGDLDLYVVNDFGRNNLFINDGAGHFVDAAAEAGAVDIGAGMGGSAADFDLDGDPDLYVTNMWSAPGQRIVEQSERFMGGEHKALHRWYTKHASGNTLLANRGAGQFEDVTAAKGGGPGYWAWGGKFVDYDNDAYADVYVPCGQTTRKNAEFDLNGFFWRGVISLTPADEIVTPEYSDAFAAIHHMLMHENLDWNGNEPNVAYQNLNGERFADVSAVCGADFLGDGRALAVLDWDGDGMQDMLIKSRTAPRLQVMHNRSRSGHQFASFDLVGVNCNRDGIGALVSVEIETPRLGKRTLRKRIHVGDGFLSQSSKQVHFGLAEAPRMQRVTVDWPDGSTDTFADLEAGQRYRIVQGAEAPVVVPKAQAWSIDAKALSSRAPVTEALPVTRVPLFVPLPMEPFPLPSREQPQRRVSDYRGAPLVVQIWTAADPSGLAGLAQFTQAADVLRATGTHVVALSVDEGPHLARARKAAAAAGVEPGYADGSTLLAYEVVTLEVLDSFGDVPLPLTLVIDPHGQLVVMYCGLPFAEHLKRDLPLVAKSDAESIFELRGGRQLLPRERRFGGMGLVFETQGEPELAKYFADLEAAAGGGPR